MRARRRAARGSLPVLAALALALPAGASDWPRYGGNDQLTNEVPAERAAGISVDTAARLSERWKATLDGRIVASPLFAEGVSVGGRPAGIVYVATGAGSVYALRVEDGSILWQRQLGAVDVSACGRGGGAARYGVSSTGVIDRDRKSLYVISADGLLYALDLATGQVVSGWPVPVIASTQAEYVWGGLALVGNRLYVPVASYCDEPGTGAEFADGRIVAVDVDNRTTGAIFDVVPGPSNLGGIWGYGGTSVDPATGHLWTATGNSQTYDATCDCIIETVGFGESVVELDRDLNVLAANRPSGIPIDPPGDTDFGSTPLLFQPPGCPPLAAAHSKNGFVYVWQRDRLADGPIWSKKIGPADLANPFIGEPSYSSELNTIFVADARIYGGQGEITYFDAVAAFTMGPGCTLPETPTWIAPSLGRGPKPPPLVVGDVLFVSGGYEPVSFAIDARNGSLLRSVALDGAGFTPPAFARDKVLLSDAAGTVRAFGLAPETIPGYLPGDFNIPDIPVNPVSQPDMRDLLRKINAKPAPTRVTRGKKRGVYGRA